MSSGERPTSAAEGKQSDTEALCPPPPPQQCFLPNTHTVVYTGKYTHLAFMPPLCPPAPQGRPRFAFGLGSWPILQPKTRPRATAMCPRVDRLLKLRVHGFGGCQPDRPSLTLSSCL